jgi:hypothetical protein
MQSSPIIKEKHRHTNQNNILSLPMDSTNHYSISYFICVPVLCYKPGFCAVQICHLLCHENVTCSLRKSSTCNKLHKIHNLRSFHTHLRETKNGWLNVSQCDDIMRWSEVMPVDPQFLSSNHNEFHVNIASDVSSKTY